MSENPKPREETVGETIKQLESEKNLSAMGKISLNALKRDLERGIIDLDDSMREAEEKKEAFYSSQEASEE